MIQIWRENDLIAVFTYKKDAIMFLQENEIIKNIKLIEVKD